MSSSPQPRQDWQPPALAELQALLPAYEFLALIGRGGMGAVYKATQISLNRPVAVKVLPGQLTDNERANFAARFRQESQTMAKLAHPGIVGVFDSGEAGGMLYIVMEFVDGTDVARMIASEGKLAPELAAKLLAQVCDALHHAHENGVVHRDIKPANLLLARDGAVKIADFGLAKSLNEAPHSLTRTNLAIGTPDFLAPEAWTPNAPLDGRADVYALGVTLYQMLTGEIPRGFWEMPSVRAGTDPRYDAVIERALQPKPEARYQSSAELRQDLERIQAQPRSAGPQPIAASPSASGAGEARRPKVSPNTLRFASAVLALAGGLALMLWPRSEKQASAPPSAAKTNRPITTASAPRPGAPPAPGTTNAALERATARWLLGQRAEITVNTGREVLKVTREQDLPEQKFDVVYLWLDRMNQPPPHPTAEGLRALRALHGLREAFVRVSSLGDDAYAFLAENPLLRMVKIEEATNVTDSVLAHLSGLGRLDVLSVTYSPRFTGRGFGGSAWLGSVRQLDFLNSGLDDGAVRVLADCPRLEYLRVSGGGITVASLHALASSATLRALLIDNAPGIPAADLAAALPSMTRLRRLELERMDFDVKAAAAAATLTNLTELLLDGTPLDDAGLAKLASLSRLSKLTLMKRKVTPEGLAAFSRAVPNCQIVGF